MKMQVLYYTLPAHIVTAIISDDWSSIEDHEKQELAEFVREQMQEQYVSTFIVCAPEKDSYLAPCNDFTNKLCEVYDVQVIADPLRIGGMNVADMYPPHNDATGKVWRMHYRNNSMAYGYTQDGKYCLIGTMEPISATVAEIIFESECAQDVEKAFARERWKL